MVVDGGQQVGDLCDENVTLQNVCELECVDLCDDHYLVFEASVYVVLDILQGLNTNVN